MLPTYIDMDPTESLEDVCRQTKEKKFSENAILLNMEDIMDTLGPKLRYGGVVSFGQKCMKMQGSLLLLVQSVRGPEI